MSQQKASEVAEGGVDSDTPTKGILGFVEAWGSPRTPFDKYVRKTSKAYFETRLDIESAAGWVKTSPAEIAAILRLAEMPDDDLAMLVKDVPPKTTWFALAEASSDGIRAGLDALQMKKSKRTAFARVIHAIRKVIGPSTSDKVGQLSGDVLIKMSKKAEKYNALSKKNRSALMNMGFAKKNYGVLTPPQVAYVTSLLTELVDKNVVRRDSPDGDVRECKAVLEALGR
jgi:hypothetical protein